jgi:surface polysaccharide O-acyltransferase-like enzyme
MVATTDQATTRLTYLDIAKVAAACAVVAIHIYGVGFHTRPPDSAGWWLANLLYTGSRWSVPMFVMVSGALLIGRQPDPIGFYRRRFRRILPAAAFFVPAYFWFATAVLNVPQSPQDIVAGLASGRPYNHLYFLSVIGGLYVLTPLLQAALRAASRRFSWGTSLGLLAMTAGDPLLGLIRGGGLSPTLVTWWIPFAGYYVLGYALSTSAPSQPLPVAGAAAAASVGIAMLAAWFATVHGGPAWAGYLENYVALPVVGM